MLEDMTKTEPIDSGSGDAQQKDTTPQQATSPLEISLLEDAKIAMELPIPEKNDFWILEKGGSKKYSRGIFSFLKRKELSEEDFSKLRDSAENAPGRAKVKIQDLLKQNPANTDLMMLYAISSFRMTLNSSNRKGVLEGLKTATRDAAGALLADGISPYNCEVFTNIYFGYLARLKRFQASTFKGLTETVRQQETKRKLETAIKLNDLLLEEKNRTVKVLNQIRGRFKSSNYNAPWEFAQIKLAGNKVEQNEPKYLCGPVEARKLIIYVMAMLDIFARIPLLKQLQEEILKLIPEGTSELYLRKAAVQSRRAFTQLNLLIKEGDRDQMRAFGRQVYKSVLEHVRHVESYRVSQSFEAEPYYNLGKVALMTFGLYRAEEQNEILTTTIESIKRLDKLDMTESKEFAQVAEKLLSKLTNFQANSSKLSAQ